MTNFELTDQHGRDLTENYITQTTTARPQQTKKAKAAAAAAYQVQIAPLLKQRGNLLQSIARLKHEKNALQNETKRLQAVKTALAAGNYAALAALGGGAGRSAVFGAGSVQMWSGTVQELHDELARLEQRHAGLLGDVAKLEQQRVGLLEEVRRGR
ncbi:MAG: hypothetical protein DRI81_07225 [Chloroflexi bacterium]|nr:MAG: hypothetical protein DRI81_07225 [Chloroflexota bacterium]